MNRNIPKEIKYILSELEKNSFEAFVVGGCVRDFLLGREPKDWDIATSAKPEQIQKIFPESVYENKFGTVAVKTRSKKERLKIVEITTYRIDEKYTDKRHPDSVRFTSSLQEDLARRDFTINAMAIEIKDSEIEVIDPFEGQGDLESKTITAVGKPEQRFSEDALRMIRAIRFACELDSSVEKETFEAIKGNAGWIQAISKERIRNEFLKIIMSDKAYEGLELLRKSGILKYVIPELDKGVGVSQNRHHIYTVYEHSILSLKFAVEKKFNLEVRLAALLHDIAKPQAKRGEGPDATFYNHDFLSAKFSALILERLRFPREVIERVTNLIRNHMFVYDVGVVTEAAVRRLLKRVGLENINDLINLRIADRLGSGVPKAQPYRLRHFRYMVEKVQHDPISAKMLKINGDDIMKTLDIEPGPKIGAIIDVLLAEVIDDPKKNKKAYLNSRVLELDKLDLVEIRKMAKKKIKEKKEEEDSEIKGKYWVH